MNELMEILEELRPDIDFENTQRLVTAAVAGRPRPESLWMVYDYYNAKAMGEGLIDMIEAMPLVRHLHYSTDLGNNDRGYPGPAELEEVTLFLKTAADSGYDGNISVEANYGKYLPHDGDLCARLTQVVALRKLSRRLLEGVVNLLDVDRRYDVEA